MTDISVEDPIPLKNKPTSKCIRHRKRSNSSIFVNYYLPPTDSAFKQQKLPAWQPILTAGTVLPTFLIIGITFVPIGIGLLISSNQVQQIVIDYTNCDFVGHNITCAEYIARRNNSDISSPCVCEVPLEIKTDYERDVFVYYGLTNFFQNHRRYVKSRDDKQLLGYTGPLTTDCEPFAGSKDGLKIAPCGAIANSLFNDTVNILNLNNREGVPLLETGIAWATDKNVKFKNPPGELSGEGAFKGYTKPPNWQKNVWELDTKHPDNNGYLNEHLIVWMRTAALPTFRKLYGRIDHRGDNLYHNGLPKGNYSLQIHYSMLLTHP